MTLILFTTRAPDPLADELIGQGHTVYEALSLSEVFALVERDLSATILITAEVDRERARAVEERYPALALKAHARVEDVLWELALLFPGTAIQ